MCSSEKKIKKKYPHSNIPVIILSYLSVNKRIGLYFQGYLKPRGFLNKSREITSYFSYFSYFSTCQEWHLCTKLCHSFNTEECAEVWQRFHLVKRK